MHLDDKVTFWLENFIYSFFKIFKSRCLLLHLFHLADLAVKEIVIILSLKEWDEQMYTLQFLT